jgi:hypothetical protein
MGCVETSVWNRPDVTIYENEVFAAVSYARYVEGVVVQFVRKVIPDVLYICEVLVGLIG